MGGIDHGGVDRGGNCSNDDFASARCCGCRIWIHNQDRSHTGSLRCLTSRCALASDLRRGLGAGDDVVGYLHGKDNHGKVRPVDSDQADDELASADQVGDGSGVPASRPGALIAAVTIAAVEAAGIAGYGISIGFAGLQNPGSVAAPIVQVVLYLLFAAGIAAAGWALWRQRQVARTPFVVVQLFALVVGYTLMQGDGDAIHRLGWLVLAMGVVGIALAMSPLVSKSLVR